MQYTPEHCLVISRCVGGQSHVTNGQNVSFKEPCATLWSSLVLEHFSLPRCLKAQRLEAQKSPKPRDFLCQEGLNHVVTSLPLETHEAKAEDRGEHGTGAYTCRGMREPKLRASSHAYQIDLNPFCNGHAHHWKVSQEWSDGGSLTSKTVST